MAPDSNGSDTRRSRSTTRRQVLAAGASAGLVSAAGCLGSLGGDDTVTVGFVLPYSGTYALLGESITQAFEMRVSELDDQLGGREVETMQQDTQAQPDRGVSATRDFLTEDDVDFIVGPVSSAVAGAMASVVDQQASAIWLNANAGNDDLLRNCVTQYHFRTSFSNWHPSAPMGQWMYDNVGERAVISYADYTAGQQYIGNFGGNFEEAGGTVVEEVGAPLGTDDYSSYLQQIDDADADLIYSFFAGGDAVNYINALHDFGIDEDKVQAGGGFLLSADTLPAQGEAAIGKYSILHYTPWKDTPANNEFRSAYEEEFDRIPNVYACQGYDTATVAHRAIEEADLDADAMIGAIEGMEVDSPRGFMQISESHDPIHDLDVRQVVEGPDGEPINEVVDTLERQQAPWSCDF